jgi:hypothetical protein
MTRVLYWNINNFSLSKIQADDRGEAARRLEYMVQKIMRGPPGDAIPDIIVVVEVYARIREVVAEGIVLTPNSAAGQGVLRLLNVLQNDPVMGTRTGRNWCVVPPLNLGSFGYREAVAVFYNAVNLQFTGPNLLYQLYGPGTNIGQSQPVNVRTLAALINYDPLWAAAMPDGMTPLGIPENQLAGEWQYWTHNRPIPSPTPYDRKRDQGRILFPDPDSRGPFLTRFLDLNHGRTLNLFSVHTSPDSADDAVRKMGEVPEMTAPLADNQVKVILGDFNIDTFDAFGNTQNPYAWMLPLYTPALDPRDLDPGGNRGNVNPARKPYCTTHLLPVRYATPFTPYNNNGQLQADPQHNVYPRFGYMGSSFPDINDSGAIDNVFTAYGANTARPAANNITVINTVTGTPYARQQGLNYPSTLVHKFPNGIDPHYEHADLEQYIFRFDENFGVIASTSDHLPLIIDI